LVKLAADQAVLASLRLRTKMLPSRNSSSPKS